MSVYELCICVVLFKRVWRVAVGGNELLLSFHSNILTQSVSIATDNSISWFSLSEGSCQKEGKGFFWVFFQAATDKPWRECRELDSWDIH